MYNAWHVSCESHLLAWGGARAADDQHAAQGKHGCGTRRGSHHSASPFVGASHRRPRGVVGLLLAFGSLGAGSRGWATGLQLLKWHLSTKSQA